ncbi:hypothetical protein [Collinsella sp. An2]|uniref:hypothetical protein n=1 Tax=Collinsella sp. An2 TaxID=1965585 RepID=UPI000B38DC0D|nr:hypothetical protein [Collinsella sp. An2]OUP07682.1 hypothetical protein B5F33_08335 [Collinsella sp. An2]
MVGIGVAYDIVQAGGCTVAQIADTAPFWFIPAGYAYTMTWVIDLGVGIWLARVSVTAEMRPPVRDAALGLVAAGCALGAAWQVLWCSGLDVLSTIVAVLQWASVAGAFVWERITGEWTRWMPFSAWGGWLAVLMASCVSGVAAQGAGTDPVAAGAGTMFTAAALLAVSYLMRRLCDDVAFGIAVVWGVVGVGIHVMPYSLMAGAFVLVIAAVGAVGALVPWETLRPTQQGFATGTRGGAARTYGASAPAPRPSHRPATRVVSAPVPARSERRRQEPTLRASSRF